MRGLGTLTRTLNADLSAALALAFVSIPSGMAYALVAGVNPIFGVYTSMVSTAVASFMGSTSMMVVTLTNALALVTADQIVELGPEADTLRALMTLTFLVGVMMALLGALQLGSIIRFVSREVMAGFIAATAVLVVIGQFKDLVGYDPAAEANKALKFIDILVTPGAWHWATALTGFGSIAALYALRATRANRFADIIVIVAGAAFVALPGLPGIETVRDIADVPRGFAALPPFVLPDLTAAPLLLGGAFAATVVALSESSGLAAAYPNRDGSRSDISRDFLAQGGANLVGAFFNALPAGGSLSRSGILANAGAQTRFAGVYSGAILALMLVLVGNQAELIPLTCLAALLTVVGIEILRREAMVLLRAARTSTINTLIALLTIAIGVYADLTTAILTGVILTLVVETVRSARRFRVVEITRGADGRWREASDPARLRPGEVTVIDLRGTVNFASYYDFDALLPDPATGQGATLILRLRDREIESLTSIDWLETYVGKLRAAGGRLMLAGVNAITLRILEQTGAAARLGADNIFPATEVYYAATERALAVAQATQVAETVTDGPEGESGTASLA